MPEKSFTRFPKILGPVLAVDIRTLLPSVNRWSSEGFERFIDSGLLSDLLDAAKGNKSGVIDFQQHGIVGHSASFQMGTVTIEQFKKLLDPLPHQGMDILRKFASLFQIWSTPASWWDYNSPPPETLDIWRKEMGLSPLNVINWK